MLDRLCSVLATGTACLVMFAAFGVTSAAAACTIPSSACYPWRIDPSESSTVLLEIVPNNTATNVIYRVCLCPPADKVVLEFDFGSKKVALGSVAVKSETSICRDFRIGTARKSRVLLSRPDGFKGAIEGCYATP